MNVSEWKELVAGLPCVATWLLTGEKVYGCQLHHLESVRDSLSEWLVVPLSVEMHLGPNGMHGLSRRGFYNRYKLDDLALIAGTIKLAMQNMADPGKVALLEAIATSSRA